VLEGDVAAIAPILAGPRRRIRCATRWAIYAGGKIARDQITGVPGSGKSTLVSVLAGRLRWCQ
jgi:putative protein kinase ArgK-like GTPase of G3E family